MVKIALLIGVSEYLPGLNSLPAAEQDIREMQRVLEHHEIGRFDNVQSLYNPSSQDMRIAIETLFSTCTRDDLVLLYFSGHGVTDDNNRFYFASCDTQKNDQGLIRSTAVSANAVHDFMEDSRSRRKVVILDCCYSGAFAKGMTAKNLMDVVDIQKQLGGEGRAVLTSSTSTQYSFEQKGSDLSVYTRYLIEGLETGAADCDEDGAISAEDLHTYAKQKVQESMVAMKPEIYVSREGFKIFLAQAPNADPAAQFRREVERLAQQGQIPDIHGDIPDVLLTALDAKSRALELSPQYAETIMAEVLKPYREHKRSLRTYERHFRAAIEDGYALSGKQRNNLQYLRKSLNLSTEDIEWIEQRILQSLELASISDIESKPLKNRSTEVNYYESLMSTAESTNSSKTRIKSLETKFLNFLRSFSWSSVVLPTVTIIAISGSIAVYLVVNSRNSNFQSPESTVVQDESTDFNKTSLSGNCLEGGKLHSLIDGPPTGEKVPENTKIEFTDDFSKSSVTDNFDWVHVKTASGQTGWVSSKRIKPCDH